MKLFSLPSLPCSLSLESLMESMAASASIALSPYCRFEFSKRRRFHAKRRFLLSKKREDEADFHCDPSSNTIVPFHNNRASASLSKDEVMGLVLSAAAGLGWTTGSGMEGPSIPADSKDAEQPSLMTFPWSLYTKSPRRRMRVAFTCNVCGQRTTRAINPHAYTDGTVFVQDMGDSTAPDVILVSRSSYDTIPATWVTFDNLENPATFRSAPVVWDIVELVLKRQPIGARTWDDIAEGLKDSMYNEFRDKFNFDQGITEPEVRKMFEKVAARRLESELNRYRTEALEQNSGDILASRHQVPNGIDADVWVSLCDYWHQTHDILTSSSTTILNREDFRFNLREGIRDRIYKKLCAYPPPPVDDDNDDD